MLNKYLKKTLFSVFFIAGCFSNALQADICPDFSTFDKSQINSAVIDWLPDGDTIYTKAGKKLRLLHINTPEINPNNDKPAEPFSKAARKALKELIGPSKKLFWISDKRKKDKYKRDLVLAFNSEGLFINAQLAAKGLAHTLVIPPNQKYWQCITAAERQAKKSRKGIWTHSRFQSKQPRQIKANRGFQLVSGKITRIVNSKKNRWLVLDDYLWVGIARKDFKNFKNGQLDFEVGEKVSFRSYVYRSYGKLRMKLRHSAMIY